MAQRKQRSIGEYKLSGMKKLARVYRYLDARRRETHSDNSHAGWRSYADAEATVMSAFYDLQKKLVLDDFNHHPEHKHTCPKCGVTLTCNNPMGCPGAHRPATCGACL